MALPFVGRGETIMVAACKRAPAAGSGSVAAAGPWRRRYAAAFDLVGVQQSYVLFDNTAMWDDARRCHRLLA